MVCDLCFVLRPVLEVLRAKPCQKTSLCIQNYTESLTTSKYQGERNKRRVTSQPQSHMHFVLQLLTVFRSCLEKGSNLLTSKILEILICRGEKLYFRNSVYQSLRLLYIFRQKRPSQNLKDVFSRPKSEPTNDSHPNIRPGSHRTSISNILRA